MADELERPVYCYIFQILFVNQIDVFDIDIFFLVGGDYVTKGQPFHRIDNGASPGRALHDWLTSAKPDSPLLLKLLPRDIQVHLVGSVSLVSASSLSTLPA